MASGGCAGVTERDVPRKITLTLEQIPPLVDKAQTGSKKAVRVRDKKLAQAGRRVMAAARSKHKALAAACAAVLERALDLVRSNL